MSPKVFGMDLSRKNIYCTHLVPICSSRKVEYDGILVCTLILNRDKKLYIYICTKADLIQSVDPYELPHPPGERVEHALVLLDMHSPLT